MDEGSNLITPSVPFILCHLNIIRDSIKYKVRRRKWMEIVLYKNRFLHRNALRSN